MSSKRACSFGVAAVGLVSLVGAACDQLATRSGGEGGGAGGPIVCPTAELIAVVDEVAGLAADESAVYWLDRGDVFRARVQDPTPVLLGHVGDEGTAVTGNRLTLDAGHVYASGGSGIFRMAKDGSSAAESFAGRIVRAHGLAVTSALLYVGRAQSVREGGSVLSVSLSSGEYDVVLSGGWIYDLEVDGSDVYWSDVGTYSGPAGQQVDNADARIGRVGPGGVTVLAEGLSETPMGIALDESFIYWADYHGSAVMRLPKSGGASELVASVVTPRDLVVAPEGLYLVGDNSYELSFLPPGASEPECLARLPMDARGHPSQIALSDDFVYVQTIVPGRYDGVVVRTPRVRD